MNRDRASDPRPLAEPAERRGSADARRERGPADDRRDAEDDNALESIGKAITDPITTAAEEEDPFLEDPNPEDPKREDRNREDANPDRRNISPDSSARHT